jgi:hypothetical protein
MPIMGTLKPELNTILVRYSTYVLGMCHCQNFYQHAAVVDRLTSTQAYMYCAPHQDCAKLWFQKLPGSLLLQCVACTISRGVLNADIELLVSNVIMRHYFNIGLYSVALF